MAIVTKQIEQMVEGSSEVAKLYRGDCFGEQALLGNGYRAAGIKCVTDCHFGVLSK